MSRWLAASLGVLVFAAVPTWAEPQEPFVIVLDWEEGSLATGVAGHGLGATAQWPVWIDACHRRVLIDLLYAPSEFGVFVGGSGAAVPYEFRVELRVGEQVFARNVTNSGFGHFLAEAPVWGDAVLTLSLESGALVDWTLRVRAWEVVGEPACVPVLHINEVEANPLGADAGSEWVELRNPGTFDLDVGGWILESTHGVANRHELPLGFTVPRDGFRIVAFPAQFLDNVNESVRLLTPSLEVFDETPIVTDEANTASSWQRVPDGSLDWAFRTATPEASNGA